MAGNKSGPASLFYNRKKPKGDAVILSTMLLQDAVGMGFAVHDGKPMRKIHLIPGEAVTMRSRWACSPRWC